LTGLRGCSPWPAASDFDQVIGQFVAVAFLYRKVPRQMSTAGLDRIDEAIGALRGRKGGTARRLFAAFPKLKKTLWGGHLWAPSYYVGTAGNVSAETIQLNIISVVKFPVHVCQRACERRSIHRRRSSDT